MSEGGFVPQFDARCLKLIASGRKSDCFACSLSAELSTSFRRAGSPLQMFESISGFGGTSALGIGLGCN